MSSSIGSAPSTGSAPSGGPAPSGGSTSPVSASSPTTAAASMAPVSSRSAPLARTGAVDGALALVEEAERLARDTDFLTVLADTLMTKAEVLRLAERRDEAARAAEEALSLWERKEFRVLADRARALLAEVS